MKELKLSEYISQAKNISRSLDKKIKIAILSSFSVNGLKEILAVKCQRIKVSSKIYEARYNQYNQEILNPKSKLYAWNPDITFLILSARSIFSDYLFSPYTYTARGRKRYVTEKIKEVSNIIRAYAKSAPGKLIVTNLWVPNYSPLGIAEEKTKFSLKESIMYFNSQIRNAFLDESKVFMYDFNAFVARHGENHVFDHKLYYLGDIQIAPDYLPYFCEDLMGYIKPHVSSNRKCIVLDLDNTLWGGIVGEDGFHNIQLGPHPPGNAYYEFQKHLLSLFQRGIILAINSKNNPQDALRVIRKHKYMLLREKHFGAIRINWNDKATNMKEIAHELNIGLDSLAFIDDDPMQRELVKKYLPEILVIDLPRDPSLYSKTLTEINDFNVFRITSEDIQRGKMYADQRKRTKFESQFSNIDDFLKGLRIRVEIRKDAQDVIPRISQLTLKTNQFNLTTKRYSEEDIKKFVRSPAHGVYSVSVEDKFGDNGITGVCIVNKKTDSEWWLDTFLLSCRVMGRNVEKTILSHIIEQARKEGAKKVVGEYIPTAKNGVAKTLYPDNGFRDLSGGKFIFNTEKRLEPVSYIKTVRAD